MVTPFDYRCSTQPPKCWWWHPTCKSRRLETVPTLFWSLLEFSSSWLKSSSEWASLCQRWMDFIIFLFSICVLYLIRMMLFIEMFPIIFLHFCVLFPTLQVIEGYEKACTKAMELLPDCVCSSAKNLHDVNEAASYIRPAVASKQYGNEEFLANLIAQACGELSLQSFGAVRFYLFFILLKCFTILLQCPFSQTLAASTLTMSEFARYWWEVMFCYHQFWRSFLFASKLAGLFRVVAWHHLPCCMAWSLRRRQRETSRQWKTPRSPSSPAPLIVWWQKPR